MAGSLNMSVTAVGVENPLQLIFLRERGCLEVQGDLFGAAMSAERMTTFLKNSGGSFADILKGDASKTHTE